MLPVARIKLRALYTQFATLSSLEAVAYQPKRPFPVRSIQGEKIASDSAPRATVSSASCSGRHFVADVGVFYLGITGATQINLVSAQAALGSNDFPPVDFWLCLTARSCGLRASSLIEKALDPSLG